MPISPRRFGHQNVTFPRDIDSMFLLNPSNNVFQTTPIPRGKTLVANDSSTDYRQSPKTYGVPIRSVTTGGIRGYRIRN